MMLYLDGNDFIKKGSVALKGHNRKVNTGFSVKFSFSTHPMLLGLLLLSLVRNGEAWSWTAHSSTHKAPRVSGHSAVTDYEHQRVLLFGGLTGSAGSPATNQLWSFDNNKDQWNLVDRDDGPGPRMYAASAILDGSMYVMGGWDPGAPKR